MIEFFLIYSCETLKTCGISCCKKLYIFLNIFYIIFFCNIICILKDWKVVGPVAEVERRDYLSEEPPSFLFVFLVIIITFIVIITIVIVIIFVAIIIIIVAMANNLRASCLFSLLSQNFPRFRRLSASLLS